MPVDASIYNALSQPRKSALDYADEFQARNTQRQMNALQMEQAQLGLTQARQSAADDAALRSYLGGGVDLSTPEGQAGLYKAAPTKAGAILKDRLGMAKDQAAIAKDNADTAKKQYDLTRTKYEHGIMSVVNGSTPDAIRQSVSDGVKQGLYSMQEATQILSDLPNDSSQLGNWRMQQLGHLLSAKDSLDQQWKARDFGLKKNNELIGEDGQVNQPLLNAKKQVAQAGKSEVNINTGQKGLDNEFKLRGEFKGEPVYKAHQEMQAAHAQIQQALKQATPAGDLAGATKIMKLLDPGSVVRESELGMAMAATGLLDRAQNYASNIISGNKLTPKQRVEFQQLADALYSESIKAFNSKRAEYDKLGGEYGLNAGRALGPQAVAPKPNVVDFSQLK